MAKKIKPNYQRVWAELGDSTKPVDSYIQNGWLAVKPPRQYMNWIQNRQDSMLAYINQLGMSEWDTDTDYHGGAGTAECSFVQGSDGKVYRCLADNGPSFVGATGKDPTNQPTNAAFWQVAFATKQEYDATAATVATHTTQIGDGSGVTDPAAWRTALDVYSQTQVNNLLPSGMVQAFAISTVPVGWLECAGQAVSRTTYANLFTAVGVVFGPGDGSTTFNLPDLRGEFIRGWDNGRGIDSARTFGSVQGDQTKTIPTMDGASATGGDHGYMDTSAYQGSPKVKAIAGNLATSGSLTNTAGTETRPRNIALMYCIKT